MTTQRGGRTARPLADRILLYLYERPQGATTTELALELSARKKAILVNCDRLKKEGWIDGALYREPRAYGRAQPSKLWKVIA